MFGPHARWPGTAECREHHTAQGMAPQAHPGYRLVELGYRIRVGSFCLGGAVFAAGRCRFGGCFLAGVRVDEREGLCDWQRAFWPVEWLSASVSRLRCPVGGVVPLLPGAAECLGWGGDVGPARFCRAARE